jgi:hypothetical protein
MKKPRSKPDHLFRLHPYSTLERNPVCGELELNYGVGAIRTSKVGEYLDALGEKGWEVDASSLSSSQENFYKNLRIERREQSASTRFHPVIDNIRRRRKSHARYGNMDDIRESVQLWVWSIFSGDEILKLLEVEDEKEALAQIIAVQQHLPTLCLELSTILVSADTPLNFRRYKALSSKMRIKVEEVLEGCSPRLMGLAKKVVGHPKSRGRSLVSSFQRRHHDVEQAKKDLTRVRRSL